MFRPVALFVCAWVALVGPLAGRSRGAQPAAPYTTVLNLRDGDSVPQDFGILVRGNTARATLTTAGGTPVALSATRIADSPSSDDTHWLLKPIGRLRPDRYVLDVPHSKRDTTIRFRAVSEGFPRQALEATLDTKWEQHESRCETKQPCSNVHDESVHVRFATKKLRSLLLVASLGETRRTPSSSHTFVRASREWTLRLPVLPDDPECVVVTAYDRQGRSVAERRGCPQQPYTRRPPPPQPYWATKVSNLSEATARIHYPKPQETADYSLPGSAWTCALSEVATEVPYDGRRRYSRTLRCEMGDAEIELTAACWQWETPTRSRQRLTGGSNSATLKDGTGKMTYLVVIGCDHPEPMIVMP